MDPEEILTVRWHLGGEFIRLGKTLDYVGGDEASSEIERDKLSLQEVKGFLKDHMPVKEGMKFYFLIPGRELFNGLVFLYDDASCVKMSEHTPVGSVAHIYVEYNGEQDYGGESSGSDFADELINLDNSEEDVPEPVLTAELDHDVIHDDVLVPDDNGMISQVIRNPMKKVTHNSQLITESSQVVNQSQHFQVQKSADLVLLQQQNSEAKHEEISDSEEDIDYVPGSDDSGEESQVVELRSKAKQFRRKMRASQRWIDGENATGPVPIDLVANVEEVLEDINRENEFESSDEDYSYDEDEDGHLVRKKSRYIRFNPDTEVPHFSLGMVFRSKNQLCKAIRRYGLVTKRSISFLKSEVDRVRVKCDWPSCPWLLYAAETSRCSRIQIITFNDEHGCAQNRDNHLVTAKVIANKYEHFILANPTWKIESMKSTVLEDFFADVSTSKCKAAKKMTQFLEVMWNGKEGFEVRHCKGRQRRYTVNLEQRTCSCGYFQLAGLPCMHAISAIYKCGREVDEFIDKCYSIEVFKKIYEHCLQPVEGEEKWPVSPKPRPQSPGYVRMPGRPKKNDRRREEGEAPKGKKMSRVGLVMKCGFCGSSGHNRSGCKKNPEKGKKKNAHLVKSGKKTKQAEQAQTDGSKFAAASTTTAATSSTNAKAKQFKPPRPASAAPAAPTRTSPRRAPPATASTSNQQPAGTATGRGKKRLLDRKFKDSGNLSFC